MCSVLVITEKFAWIGGAIGATYLYTNILIRSGLNVTVVTSNAEQISSLSSLKILQVPDLTSKNKQSMWVRILINKSMWEKIMQKSDVVYIPRHTYPLIHIGKKLGKKVVVHLHDYAPFTYTAIILAPFKEHRHIMIKDDLLLERIKGLKYYAGAALLWWLPKLARELVTEADTVICVSHNQAQIVSELVPKLKKKIKVIYNPVPPELLQVEVNKELDETPTFLYVGGDHYIKGFYVLLEALKALGEKSQLNFKLILAGDYGQKSLKLLNQLKRRCCLNIEIKGKVGYDELIKLHSKAWALLFPSVCEEPLPYAVIESCLLKTIPIASNVGGVPELINDTPAKDFMFYPGSPKQLTEKMEIVASKEPKEIHEIANAVRKVGCEKINNEVIEKEFVDALEIKNK